MSTLSKIKMLPVWFVTLGVVLVSYRFLALGLENAFPGMLEHITQRRLAFILHISASPIALGLGLFQFLPKLRAKRPAIHRWTGRLYVATVLIGGLAGLILAVGSLERPVAAFGFGILAVIWLGITGQAIRMAMAGRIVEHRRWMIRSYALTFAAVTLRLFLPLFFIFGEMDYAEASNYVAWISWVLNLIIAELYLSRGTKSGAAMAAPA